MHVGKPGGNAEIFRPFFMKGRFLFAENDTGFSVKSTLCKGALIKNEIIYIKEGD